MQEVHKKACSVGDILRLTWIVSLLNKLLYWAICLYLRYGQPKQRKRIAIFKADGIGDFVMSFEAMRLVVHSYGVANVSLILADELKVLAAHLFPGVEILPIVPGHKKLLSRLKGLPALRAAIRANTYSEVLCLRHYRGRYDDTILRALHTAKVILLPNQLVAAHVDVPEEQIPVHFRFAELKEGFYSFPQLGLPREWSFHATVLSETFGRLISTESLQPHWDAESWACKLEDPFLLIAPLAGRRYRDLPKNLVRAAARTAFRSGLRRIVVSGSREQSVDLNAYTDNLREVLPLCRIEVVQPNSLPALVSLMATAALVFTAETSTSHIAAALDKHALIIIGGGHYGWFAPWKRSSKQVWLTNPLPCFECNWRCIYPEPFCITKITAAQVEAALPTRDSW